MSLDDPLSLIKAKVQGPVIPSVSLNEKGFTQFKTLSPNLSLITRDTVNKTEANSSKDVRIRNIIKDKNFFTSTTIQNPFDMLKQRKLHEPMLIRKENLT